MMRVWATVVSWHQGIALVDCEPVSGCGGCGAKQGCGVLAFNQARLKTQYQWRVAIEQPLEVGQKIEIALTDSRLLRCVIWMYLPPLLGLLVAAAIGQWLTGSEGWSVWCAVMGTGLGYGVARYQTHKITRQQLYQPVVLQIGLSPSMIQTSTNI